METPFRVVQYGLGPIGQEVARTVLKKQTTGALELVGAIDIDPDKVGRDVTTIIGENSSPSGIRVREDAEQVLAETEPDVVLHSTTSFLDGVSEQFKQCVEAGADVVSSTEELAFPFDRHPELADQLDQAARQSGQVIVGTGVNPGYAMDTLALAATGTCVSVEAVEVERIVDASKRRRPLQEKIGAGLSTEAFAEKKATGTFGHIGLRESLLMLADGLGWSLEGIEETLDPVVAEERAETPFLTVEEGEVAGIHHAIEGRVGGAPALSLSLKMYVGAESSRDAVTVEGDPPIDLVVQNGIFGDTATVGALVNTIPLAVEASPGLQTMKDLPVPRAFATAAKAAVPQNTHVAT